MYSFIKGIFAIIFSIISTLFILFGLIYILYIIKIIINISAFAIHEPSIQLTLIVFILLSIFLLIQWYKEITNWVIFLYLLFSVFIFYTVNIYLIEKRISTIAIEKYSVEPSYISINFDIDAEFKEAHAVIHKKGKTYYWSFSENDFILNTNPNLHL